MKVTEETIYLVSGLLVAGSGLWLYLSGQITRLSGEYDQYHRPGRNWPALVWRHTLAGRPVALLAWLQILRGGLVTLSCYQEYQKIHPNILDVVQNVVRRFDVHALDKNILWGLIVINLVLLILVPGLLSTLFSEKSRAY